MKVAVTGGSGVVGRAVVRHLVEDGHEVRGLARSAAAAAALVGLGALPVNGDILDTDSLDDLLSRCEWVFHIAGVNEMCSRDPDRMWRANVSGSVNVVEASARAGARRVIHTSSAVTIGEPKGEVGSETSKHRGHFLSEYERSKTVAERLVLGSPSDIEVVSVNPSSVQGPGRATRTGALFLALARGVPLAVDTTMSLVDIDDCARGHLLAAERGAPGERYLLSGAVLSVREAVRLLETAMDRRQRPWFVRPGVVTKAASLLGPITGLMGGGTPLCAESARVLLHGHRYDGSRATRDLALEYTPIMKTLERTISWFHASGLL